MIRIDSTVVIERLAHRLRGDGAEHPVAAAVALAARGHTRLDQAEFAAALGITIDLLGRCEIGAVAFGALPPQLGTVAAAAGAELLVLADLESQWRLGPEGQVG